MLLDTSSYNVGPALDLQIGSKSIYSGMERSFFLKILSRKDYPFLERPCPSVRLKIRSNVNNMKGSEFYQLQKNHLGLLMHANKNSKRKNQKGHITL
jgi:hypothetical protein